MGCPCLLADPCGPPPSASFSVAIDQLCVHECHILGRGGQYWPQPTFKVQMCCCRGVKVPTNRGLGLNLCSLPTWLFALLTTPWLHRVAPGGGAGSSRRAAHSQKLHGLLDRGECGCARLHP